MMAGSDKESGEKVRAALTLLSVALGLGAIMVLGFDSIGVFAMVLLSMVCPFLIMLIGR